MERQEIIPTSPVSPNNAMKSLLYPALLALSLTACRPFDSLVPEAPGNAGGTPKPATKTCQLTRLSLAGTIREFAFQYDSTGKLTRYDARAAYARLSYGSSFAYDAHGFLTKETFVVSPFIDSYTVTNSFSYDARSNLIPRASLNQTLERDAAGRVVKLTKRTAANAVAYVIAFAYNALGRKIRQEVTYPDGRRLTWKWDALGENVVRFERTDGQGALSQAIEYTYDRSTNPLKALFNFKGWDPTDYLNVKGWHPFDTYEDFGYVHGGFHQPVPLALYTSRNNVVKEVSTSANGNLTTMYAYEYNAAGFPTSAQVRNETTGAPTTTETRQFGYQNCP